MNTNEALALQIDAILPQTQCRKCGYSGCKPYALAIVGGQAEINQCPPGGARGIMKLAALLGREFKPLDPAHGVEQARTVARIDEALCIGCTLCIQACPVDAIVGAAKQMHTVVSNWCTGCELCLAPCPVDCISMPLRNGEAGDLSLDDPAFANLARARHQLHSYRTEREKQEKAARLNAKSLAQHGNDPKQALIAAAIARAQMQKERIKPANTQQLTAEQLAQIAEIEARRSAIDATAVPLASPEQRN